MLTLEEALERLLAHAVPTGPEELPIADALGRVLTDARVVAAMDVPPFANSAMDGVALRAADTPGELHLTGSVAAGDARLPTVGRGEAVRITTGAPLPPGADAVVPVEEIVESGDLVTVPAATTGAFVRPAGSDVVAGTEVCLPGALRPAALAVLASIGIASVAVHRRPVVAVLSSGDELAPPGSVLRPGQIYDANGPALAAAVSEAGGAPRTVPRVPDREDAVRDALQSSARDADLVVTSAGVSVGQRDLVRAAIEEHGELDFWRVAVQPGKPLAVGKVDGKPVVGLPGNPVSALVTFELFVRPLIRRMQGLHGDGRLRISARPQERMEKDPGRRAFLRVQLRREGGEVVARSAGGQGSAQLRPLAEASGLLVVPEGEAAADPANRYEAILLGALE